MFSIKKESHLNQAIPENSKGLVSTINVLKSGKIEDLNVHVAVAHNFIGDLTMELTSPSGKKVKLHDRAGGRTKNLDKTYGKEVFENILGTEAGGKWKLTIKDNAPKDNGSLTSWAVDLRCSAKNAGTEMMLPAKASQSLTSVQESSVSGKVTDLKVMVDINHPNTDELKVDLIAPSGKVVTLHNNDGGKKNLKKTYSGEILQSLIGQQTAGQWKLRMSDRSANRQGRLRHWKVSFKYSEINDLKKVEGIGPKIESLLNAAGVFSWSRLSVTSPAFIKDVLIAAGDRFKMHDPESWPLQAGMAAAGEWEKLNKWQDSHKGGRMS